jgi:hypothetical protein
MAVANRIKTIFQFRRSTTAEWELNKDIIPAAGEPCFDLDLGTLRIGDGTTTYENLKVIGSGTISDDGLSVIVKDLQTDIDALQELIGETSVEEQISNAMTDVAKASDLETVVNNMTTLESKVTTSNDNVTEMQTIIEQNTATVTELQTIVEQKADAVDVTELQAAVEQKADSSTVTELHTIIEQKANMETVTELQTIIENKVDTEAVETLEKELKIYINEKIGNIDDGEI